MEILNHTCSFHERSGAGREGGEVQERWREEGDIFPLAEAKQLRELK